MNTRTQCCIILYLVEYLYFHVLSLSNLSMSFQMASVSAFQNAATLQTASVLVSERECLAMSSHMIPKIEATDDQFLELVSLFPIPNSDVVNSTPCWRDGKVCSVFSNPYPKFLHKLIARLLH